MELDDIVPFRLSSDIDSNTHIKSSFTGPRLDLDTFIKISCPNNYYRRRGASGFEPRR